MSRPQRMQTDSLAILTVTNWTNSKASTSADRGVSSLKEWLEKKAGRSIQDFQVDGNALQIAVSDSDKQRFLHINGWRWAGIDVVVVDGQHTAPPPPQQRNARNQPQQAPSAPRNQPNGFGNRQQNNDLASRMTGQINGVLQQNSRNQQKDLFDQAPNGPRNGYGARNNQPNGNSFGGQNDRSNNSRNSGAVPQSSQKDATLDVLTGVIHRRYSPNEKFLDLSSLASDPDIISAGLTSETPEKVWSALFIVCEQRVFETFQKRRDMVESISFKSNGIKSLREVIAAASTFVKLKNLDLSNNDLQKMSDLTWWRKRFPDLEQIILSGNPVDSPQTRDEVRKWYRNLKTYNMAPLDAPFPASINPLGAPLEIQPPAPTSSPVPGAGPNGELLTAQQHPEFGPGSTFGLPVAGKPDDQVLKEQMGLKFSYETRLKMQFVEEVLSVNNWVYDAAMSQFMETANSGNVPADAFLQV